VTPHTVKRKPTSRDVEEKWHFRTILGLLLEQVISKRKISKTRALKTRKGSRKELVGTRKHWEKRMGARGVVTDFREVPRVSSSSI